MVILVDICWVPLQLSTYFFICRLMLSIWTWLCIMLLVRKPALTKLLRPWLTVPPWAGTTVARGTGKLRGCPNRVAIVN